MVRFSKYLSKFNIEEIKRLSDEGLNLKQIAEKIDIPSRRLGEMLKENNISLPKGYRYKVNDTFFDSIDSEIKAYLLGFFVADGCMQKEAKYRNGEIYSYSYRMMFCNSIDDKDIIELFQQYICPSKKLEYSNNQSGVKVKRKSQIHFKWNSKYMFETLLTYNIISRKTYDFEFKFPFEKIPLELHRHFIRGFFDGNGHKGISDISFVATSKKFLLQIVNFFKGFKYRIDTCKSKNCTYYNLYILGGKESLNKINDIFYKDSNYFLKRKYLLFNPEVIVETKESTTPQSVEIEPEKSE